MNIFEAIRTFIIAALVFVGFLLWQSWQENAATQKTPPVTQTENTSVTPNVPLTETVPSIPDLPISTTTPASTENITADGITAQSEQKRWIMVNTDVMDVAIDTQGGNVVHLDLLNYAQSLDDKQPLVLFNTMPGQLYVAESGLVSEVGPDIPGVPNVREQKVAQYKTEQKKYVLDDGQDELKVVLAWKNNEGLHVEKVFTFYRGKYSVDVQYTINNKTRSSWVGSLFMQFKRDEHLPTKANFFAFPSYFGSAISSPEKRYEKIPLEDLQIDLGTSLGRSVKDGWLAMVQHYFVSAWIPDSTQTFQYSGGAYNHTAYFLRAVGQPVEVPANTQMELTAKLYAGPKITDALKEVAPKLDLTVDYGWLWPISQALFWVMKQIYDVIGNWGWAIVAVTVLIKLAFYKLSAASYRSMANMRRLQPKFVALKERYGDDRQKMSQELMALYKKEKINPLGGCLPILVQIPVFIALYWVLIESVEFRMAPFIFWIQDLSMKDPYYVLPLLMGLTMFVQQRLSPQPPDPLQAKVMMFMPIMFTVIFLTFPSGLVLYWLVNNILSIAQQWYITREIEKQFEAKK